MQKLIPVVTLLALATSSVAVAQTPTPSARPVLAPVGHRQPTANSVPADVYNDQVKDDAKQDAMLDKKIKSICRGC